MSVMLARTARQATRAAQRTTKQSATKAPRLARSYATPASASGPHERASGFNSAAAGAGVFGATVLLGYVMGVLGDYSGRDAALKKLDAGASSSSGSSKTASIASKGSKAVEVVSKKADEAAESMPTKPATKSSKKAKGGKSAPSHAETSSPSVSATGATTPLPSLDEPSSLSRSPSPTTSISDPGSLSETEEPLSPPEGEEDARQAAFNPETGEINWDCPCLGGMAHGVCGEQFKEAFSCFVYSEEEPKGQDCIDKFRAMQDCFRAHPEIYGEEVAGSDDDEQEYDVVDAVEAALAEESQKQA